MLFFDNEYFYIDGLEGAIKLYSENDWRISALIRHHFIDIPADIQNQVQADTADWGAQLRYYTSDNTYLDTESLSDFYGNTHGKPGRRPMLKVLTTIPSTIPSSKMMSPSMAAATMWASLSNSISTDSSSQE